VKDSQVALYKIITWTKKKKEKKARVGEAWMDSGLRRKLKTPVKTRLTSKVIIFEKPLEFKAIILLCYSKQNTLSL
jgi:hypothetical protein